MEIKLLMPGLGCELNMELPVGASVLLYLTCIRDSLTGSQQMTFGSGHQEPSLGTPSAGALGATDVWSGQSLRQSGALLGLVSISELRAQGPSPQQPQAFRKVS